MENDLVNGLRYTLVFSAFFMTLTIHDDLHQAAAIPFKRFWGWCLRLSESFRTRRPENRARSFWEIDMTEFEP
jgi:hypothetical protein